MMVKWILTNAPTGISPNFQVHWRLSSSLSVLSVPLAPPPKAQPRLLLAGTAAKGLLTALSFSLDRIRNNGRERERERERDRERERFKWHKSKMEKGEKRLFEQRKVKLSILFTPNFFTTTNLDPQTTDQRPDGPSYRATMSKTKNKSTEPVTFAKKTFALFNLPTVEQRLQLYQFFSRILESVILLLSSPRYRSTRVVADTISGSIHSGDHHRHRMPENGTDLGKKKMGRKRS